MHTPSTDPARRTGLRKLAALGAAPILWGYGAASGTSQGQPASPAGQAPPPRGPSPAHSPSPASAASAAGNGSPARYIDVHCHIFNARDVPTYSFVEDVFLENKILKGLGAPLVLLITQTCVRAAPDYPRERDALDRPPGGPYLTPASLEFPSDEAIFAAGFKAFLRGDPPFTDDRSGVKRSEKHRLVRRLYDTFPHKQIDPALGPEQFAQAIEDKNISELFKKLQEARTRRGDKLAEFTAQFLTYFAIHVAYPRFRLARELETQGPDAGTPRLLTPATLDICKWLVTARSGRDPSPPPTTLAQQSELMRLIALQPGASLVHGFIAFDPWRYAEELAKHQSPNALDIVKTALTRDGFVGVKLYPPMGFRATDNAKRPPDEFPDELRRAVAPKHPGLALDEALAELYAYCVANDVPIMAHCAATQGTSHQNALCANPKYWCEALRNFPRLRLNLAHFGAVWNLATVGIMSLIGRFLPVTGYNVSWTADIVQMIEDNDFPNLYADFGDFWPVLGRWDTELERRKRIFEKLRGLVKNASNPKIRSRLMYGSDWLLLGREPGSGDYYVQMRDSLLPELGMSPDDFFWKNAARFLGLAQGGATRDRLRKFYSDNRRDPSVLDPFQP